MISCWCWSTFIICLNCHDEAGFELTNLGFVMQSNNYHQNFTENKRFLIISRILSMCACSIEHFSSLFIFNKICLSEWWIVLFFLTYKWVLSIGLDIYKHHNELDSMGSAHLSKARLQLNIRGDLYSQLFNFFWHSQTYSCINSAF